MSFTFYGEFLNMIGKTRKPKFWVKLIISFKLIRRYELILSFIQTP